MTTDLRAQAQAALRSGSSFRGVRRATLTLPDETSAFAARQALEDALRTADFHDAGRLIVVRRLRLRALPAQARGPQWARALEAAWQTVAAQAQPFDAPAAGDAPAVYFRSVHAARRAWLAACAAGTAPDDWFWPRALPELASLPVGADAAGFATAAQGALPEVLAALATEAPAEVPALLNALPPPQVVNLLRHLPAAPVGPLAAWVDAVMPAADRPSTTPQANGAQADSTTPPAAVPPAASPLQAAVATAFESQDWRRRWAAAVLDWADPMSVPAAAPSPSAGARPTVDLQAPPPSDADPRVTPSMPVRPLDVRDEGPPAPLAAPAPAGIPVPGERPAPAQPHRLSDAAPPTAPDAPHVFRQPWQPWLGDNAATRHGGLLMLLNALDVLGYGDWWEAQPAAVRAGFTPHLLATLARRIRMPADDPQRPLLQVKQNVMNELTHAPVRWDRWPWPAAVDARGLWPATDSVASALACWQRVLGRALRHHAGVGPVRLVTRAGGVSLTATHVDIVLPLDGADARVRRAGLDRDPGWLPWFGRIVQFHYLEGADDGTA